MEEVVVPTPSRDKKKSRWWIWVIAIGTILLLLGFFVMAGIIILVSSDGSLGPLEGNKIGVVRLDGVISGGGGEVGLLGSEGGTSPENFRENLEDALEDDSVKAIVIRVNSPGGTPAASQEMFQDVKEAAKKKPVIASVSDVAASGGYYAISPVKIIMADPASYVGSIGVYQEVPIMKDLFKKLGVDFTILKAGKYKALGHPAKTITSEEKKILQKQVNEVYEQFIDDVDKGRKNLNKKEVADLANGLAFPGSEAKRLGLVDKIGNYSKAIKLAAKLAKIKNYEVKEYNKATLFDFGSLIESFFNRQLPREEIKIR